MAYWWSERKDEGILYVLYIHDPQPACTAKLRAAREFHMGGKRRACAYQWQSLDVMLSFCSENGLGCAKAQTVK